MIVTVNVFWFGTIQNKSPSTFELSLAVNFQMSRSIYDNKPVTPDTTLNRSDCITFWRAADKTAIVKGITGIKQKLMLAAIYKIITSLPPQTITNCNATKYYVSQSSYINCLTSLKHQ